MRLIDADTYPCASCGAVYCIANCDKYWAWFNSTVVVQHAAQHWIDDIDHWICPVCRLEVTNPNNYESCKCPRCGFQDSKDAEPVRHGRWVESDIRYAVTDLLEGEYPESLTCSRCGFKHKFADEYGYSCIWHYCPNCGAKMDLK